MIREIHIKNFALIDELSLELGEGFTVFTGETGAGKSILIGAISLLLGERASQEAIRSGTEEAEVSGVFDLRRARSALKALLDEFAVETPDETLIVRRRIARGDRNKIFVNQTPLPLAALKRLGDNLVDLHGQHEHQSLLDEETHAAVIDDLPTVREVKTGYTSEYERYRTAKNELESFEAKAAALAERKEMLEYQHKELADLSPRPGEEAELQSELSLLSSFTQRREAASEIIKLLASSPESVERQIAAIRRKLDTLAGYDPTFKPWVEDVGNALSVLTELETVCGSYLHRFGEDADPQRIERLNSRLARIQRLKKKYACSLDELIKKRDALKADLSSIGSIDSDKNELVKKTAARLSSCKESGLRLGAARRKAAAEFDKKVSALMEQLGFKGGLLLTNFIPRDDPAPGGLEDIRFMVHTNPGEPMLPLARTASGGEISRLMLAMKTVMSEHDRIPILIFDEIDTGIGGMLATSVASSLRALSATHQVLCISHLHQIAALADNHFQVYKEPLGDRTVTRVRPLDERKRVDEIARMLGGDSTIARRHAKELLTKGK